MYIYIYIYIYIHIYTHTLPHAQKHTNTHCILDCRSCAAVSSVQNICPSIPSCFLKILLSLYTCNIDHIFIYPIHTHTRIYVPVSFSSPILELYVHTYPHMCLCPSPPNIRPSLFLSPPQHAATTFVGCTTAPSLSSTHIRTHKHSLALSLCCTHIHFFFHTHTCIH